MPGEYAPDFVDRFYQRIAELLPLKMRSHSFNDPLPEFIAAFFMNRVVANNRKFMNTRRDKNEHSIVLARLVHTEPMKPLPRRNQGITPQIPTLDQNANLTGRFRFSFPNNVNDPGVLEFAEEFSRSHLSPARSRAASAETSAATAKPAEAAAATTAATGRPAATTTSWDKHRAAAPR